MKPDLSVVIPYYNRAETIPLVLESVARARAGLQVEVILVDDGSAIPAEVTLRDRPHCPDLIIRQEHRGLLFARLRGLEATRGEYVLFLDSDDLVSPEKFSAQLQALRKTGAQVSYTDTTGVELKARFDEIVADASVDHVEETTDGTTFFIRVQPVPHSPIFHAAWLKSVVAEPLFPPSPAYNAVAEIWFYHIAAPLPTTVVKVAGAHTLVGRHGGARLTNHWEKLGVASLGVMESFDRACPCTPATEHVRRLLGAKVFGAWRRLPHDFLPEFDVRMLALWRRNPGGDLASLGGRSFQCAARILGPELAGRLFRRLQGSNYASCRTVADPAEIRQWLAQLPG